VSGGEAGVNERRRHILRCLRREPGSTIDEIARFAGADVRHTQWTLEAMRARGLVWNRGKSWFCGLPSFQSARTSKGGRRRGGISAWLDQRTAAVEPTEAA
jgi:DNA-binding IclR family transcriptional regulator